MGLLMTPSTTDLVTSDATPAFGPLSITAIPVDEAVDRIVSSTAPISKAVNGHRNPERIAELIRSRLADGNGATTATIFAARQRPITAISGVVVGVTDQVVQFADEHKSLRTWPIATVIALIAD